MKYEKSFVMLNVVKHLGCIYVGVYEILHYVQDDNTYIIPITYTYIIPITSFRLYGLHNTL